MTVKEGDVLAEKYLIEKLLGEGGMGAVWIATNTVLQKRVALKVMSERFSQVPAAATRFHREAIAASKVSHPSICQVFDAGKHEGQPWIAMELLAGVSLGDRLTDGPMNLEDVLRMATGTLSALAEVHEQGIVHRDLKPDNIFLADDRRGSFVPKVLDFGVAKDTRGEQLNKLTATGAVVGTAYYLSPEQAKGLPDIDGRADVYAMGVVLFECLSGRMPYEADTITQLIAKMFTEAPQHLLHVAPDVPSPIADVVTTCLHQDRERRFQTARALLGAVEAATEALRTGTAPKDPALAATGYAMSANGTAQGAPNVASSPGVAPPGAYAGHPSHGNSAPGLAGTSMGHGQAVGASTPGHPMASGPGMHGSAPGMHGSAPGMHGSGPGMHAPGSGPGMHAPGSGPGMHAPGMHPGHTAGGRPVPQTAFMNGQMTAPPAHAQPAPSGSKLGLIALVVVLFLVGAAGTGAAVWALSGDGASSGDAVAVANTGPDVTNDPTPGDPDPTPDVPTDVTEPPIGDPEAPNPDGAGDPPVEVANAQPHRRRRGRNHARNAPDGPDAPDQPDTPVAAPDTNPDSPVASPDPEPDPPRQDPDRPTRPDRPTPPPARPGLTQAQVNTVVRARLQYLSDRCYQRVLRREPNVRGIVTVAWTVQPNGRVGDHRVVHNGTNNDYLARCTDNIVRGLRFPAASNGQSTPARYPFNFQAM